MMYSVVLYQSDDSWFVFDAAMLGIYVRACCVVVCDVWQQPSYISIYTGQEKAMTPAIKIKCKKNNNQRTGTAKLKENIVKTQLV